MLAPLLGLTMRTLLIMLILAGCSRAPVSPLERPSGDSAEAMRVRSAVAALSGAAQRNPGNWTTLATAWLQLGRLEADAHAMQLARAAALRALELDPKSEKALVIVATLEQAAGNYAEARRAAERVTRMNAQNAAAWGALGDALLALGESAEAFAAYDRFVELAPGIPAYTRVAYARWLLGDVDGSLALYEAAARNGHVSEPEPLAYTAAQAGDVLASVGRVNEADNAYAAALYLVPRYPDAVLGRGRIALNNHDYGSAARDFMTLLATDRRDDALPMLGVALAGAL